MKLTFLGTRGEIDVRTTLHRMHSCLMVTGRILIDCGADWLGKLEALKPQAIVLTHAHPDHAGGLKCGSRAQFTPRRRPGMVSSGIRFESGRLLSPGTLFSSAVLSSKPFRSHTH